MILKEEEQIKSVIQEFMTTAEISRKWDIRENTIRVHIRKGKFEDCIRRGLVRQSGSIWIFHAKAVYEIYGKPHSFPKQEYKPLLSYLKQINYSLSHSYLELGEMRKEILNYTKSKFPEKEDEITTILSSYSDERLGKVMERLSKNHVEEQL